MSACHIDSAEDGGNEPAKLVSTGWPGLIAFSSSHSRTKHKSPKISPEIARLKISPEIARLIESKKIANEHARSVPKCDIPKLKLVEETVDLSAPIRLLPDVQPVSVMAVHTEVARRTLHRAWEGALDTLIPNIASEGTPASDPINCEVDMQDIRAPREVLFHARFLPCLLLSMRFVCEGCGPPNEIACFRADDHPLAWKQRQLSVPRRRSGCQQVRASSRSASAKRRFGVEHTSTDPVNKTSEQPSLLRSKNAYVFAKSDEMLPRMQQLQRDINSLLNKVCPENIATIVERIVDTKIQCVDELELLITLIFKKALAEPHYCETYAGMVAELKRRMPEFPSVGGGRPITFRIVLINATQSEFESLTEILTLSTDETTGLDIEEIEFLRKKRKHRVLANMKFIGQLFLRSLLTAKIIGSVIEDLAGCGHGSAVPEEPMVECICELLFNIGFTLDSSEQGRFALSSVCSRLRDLKGQSTSEGRGVSYSKRIQFAIQDVLDARAAGWTHKTFKATAKTKDEIRRQQENELRAHSRGKSARTGQLEVLGARPRSFT